MSSFREVDLPHISTQDTCAVQWHLTVVVEEHLYQHPQAKYAWSVVRHRRFFANVQKSKTSQSFVVVGKPSVLIGGRMQFDDVCYMTENKLKAACDLEVLISSGSMLQLACKLQVELHLQ